MPWSNQGGGGGGGPWGGGGKGPWGSGGPQSSGPTPPDLEEILRRGQDKLRRVLPGGSLGGRGFALLAVAGDRALGLFRLLPRRTRRTRRRAALRQGRARGAAGPELSSAVSDRDRAHAEGAARQQDRYRHAHHQRHQRPLLDPRRAGGEPDAHRRREHRRRRFLGAVEGQADRRRRISVQHPESGRHGEGGGGKRHARSHRPFRHPADPDRRAADHRSGGAGADAEDARQLRRRHLRSSRCSCRRSTRRRR